MVVAEIDNYLQIKNKIEFDDDVEAEIKRLWEEAIIAKEEAIANLCWCYNVIYNIQKKYIHIYNQLKVKKYEEAWNLLENVSIAIGNLVENFDVGNGLEDPYQIHFIKHEIKQFIRLFPYTYFLSREEIVKEELCSICRKKITLRDKCGHRIGKLYMGKMCSRIITKTEPIAFALVKDPVDMYAVIRPDNFEFNYCAIDMAMKVLKSPYEKWYVDIFPILKKEFDRKIGRNEFCPCKSGRKFKNCCMGTQRMYKEHYRINILESDVKVQGNCRKGPIG